MSAVVRLCCAACTEGLRQLIFCLVRRMAATAKTAFIALCLYLAVSVVAVAATPDHFVGSFAGASVRSDSSGRSFVVCLEVSERAGTYSLVAFMNDTNREPGMDHTSNTHWHWTGSGAIRGSALEFTFSSAAPVPEKGSLRRTRAGMLLKLGAVQYRIKRASEPCQSDNPPNRTTQRTASRIAICASGACPRASDLRASRAGIAAADLVSR